MTAAIKAAEAGENAGKQVNITILDHSDRLGKKLRMTGNGHCNLTNEVLSSDPLSAYSFADQRMLRNLFDRFGFEDTLAFFRSLGICIRNRDGLIYPYSDEAVSVVSALSGALERYGIRVITDCGIRKIDRTGSGFTAETTKGVFHADRLILACGGASYPKTGSDGSGYALAKSFGHRVNTPVPGLVRLVGKGSFFKNVAGVRMKGRMSLFADGRVIKTEDGELQLTEKGISGIAVMNLSNLLSAEKGPFSVRIDLMPEFSEDMIRSMLADKIRTIPGNAAELFTGILPRKLGAHFLKTAKIRPDIPMKEIGSQQIKKLTETVKKWEIGIEDTGSFEEAQITLGGVDTADLEDTLESRIVPGLYFAGEILDLHGFCGGYNLQLCWTTGAVAGVNAVCAPTKVDIK